MLETLYRRVLLPAYESGLKRRNIFRYWDELERTQWLSRTELQARQLQSLRRLLEHASQNCPYYRGAWQAHGLNPGQLRTPDDYQRWPIVDRDTIREHRFQMRADLPGIRLLPKATGGSSGVPLAFDTDTDNYDWRHAAWHRGYTWAHAGPGSKQLYLWGVPLGGRSWWKQHKDDLYNRLFRRHILNCFELTEERVPEFLSRLNRFRPEVIVAYTNPLYTFARFLEEQHLQPYAPRSIVVGAEKLYDFQRTLIEKVFQAPVFETYGSREFTFMAGECDRHEGLHISMENLLIEVVDENGRSVPAGVEGDVVVTDLTNFGMPFVRYRNGDRAVASAASCSCGRGLPLLRKIVGRQLDMLQTPDGRQIPGEFFPHLLKEFAAVRRFQVVQEKPERIELRLVLRGEWTEADRRRLDEEVRNVIGWVVQFEVVPVDDIPLTAQGKLRVVVNHCSRASNREPDLERTSGQANS